MSEKHGQTTDGRTRRRSTLVRAVVIEEPIRAVVIEEPIHRCDLCETEGDEVTCPAGHPDLRTVYPGIEGLRPWPIPGANVGVSQTSFGVVVNVREGGVFLPVVESEFAMSIVDVRHILAMIRGGAFYPWGSCDALVMALFYPPGHNAEPEPEFNHWDPEYY